MTDRINQLKTLIEGYTSYTGTATRLSKFTPNKQSNGFSIMESQDSFNNNLQHHQKYIILLKADSQANLEAMIKEFLQMSSNNPNGYDGTGILSKEFVCDDGTEDVEYTYDEALSTWSKVSNSGVNLNIINSSSLPPDAIGNSAFFRFPLPTNNLDLIDSLVFRLYTSAALSNTYMQSLNIRAYLDEFPDPDSIATEPIADGKTLEDYVHADDYLTQDADTAVDFEIWDVYDLLTTDKTYITLYVEGMAASSLDFDFHSTDADNTYYPRLIRYINIANHPYWISMTQIPLPSNWEYKPTAFRAAIEIEGRWAL